MRTIQIANTKTQRRYSIETEATTLGELQDEMTRMGIDFTGMTFTEGISKTQLLGRESLLPTNVMYKGQPTNNLVMLLTNTTKQISSGCEGRSRKEAYAIIKEMGVDAMDEIKEEYGRNYTQVTTNDLWDYIDENYNAEDDVEDLEGDEVFEDSKKSETNLPDVKSAPHPDTVEWLYTGVKAQVKDGSLFIDDVVVLADLLGEYARRLVSTNKISNDEIDEMIASL